MEHMKRTCHCEYCVALLSDLCSYLLCNVLSVVDTCICAHQSDSCK